MTEELEFDFREKPREAQVIGVKALVGNPFFGLFDEMGVGKTKQTIDATQVLFRIGAIKKVMVVCPASVRSVWFDPEFGELQKHLWNSVPNKIMEYHNGYRKWSHGNNDHFEKPLLWVITNYDFIRRENRLEPLLSFCDKETFLVIDESSAVKNWKANQTRACMKLREKCGRVVLLNGTPIANSPGDMYSQGQLMSKSILQCGNWYKFRARYGVMGGFKGKQIKGWDNIEDLQRRFQPYVLRRLKSECWDLPPKIPEVTLTVSMNEATWAIYTEMKNDMLAWLSEQKVSMAPQAIVRIMRLAQITSGFLGGLESDEGEPLDTEEIGNEKAKFFMKWLEDHLDENPGVKILVWCRFRAELKRLEKMLLSFGKVAIGTITGSQKKVERNNALRLLDPRTTPNEPVVVVGNPKAGAIGLNLAAANVAFYMSNDYSLMTRQQSEDRIHRPGQTKPVSYFDLIATGPNGEKTVDHLIIRSLRRKENLANMTVQAWMENLEEED